MVREVLGSAIYSSITESGTVLEVGRMNRDMSPLETLLIESLEEYPEVELAVIFGSVARAEAGRKSDVDVGVRFQVPSRVLLSRLEVDLSRALNREVEVIALDDAPPLLRFEIARDGKVLVERKPHAWADFRARAMVDWWDWAPLARRIHAAAAARLRKRASDGPT